MLTSEEENYILSNAYVPEHSVGLITSLSDGVPYLIDDYFCCRKEYWLIVIGYPLQKNFTAEGFEAFINSLTKRFQPKLLSVIAPVLSPAFSATCKERERDFYYTMDPQLPLIRGSVKRNLRKSALILTVERSRNMDDGHQELIQEFRDRVRPSVQVENLLYKMPHFVQQNDQSLVLNARDSNHKLTAFYVVDLAPKNFANYIIGCHSKKNYVLGASDLLLFELIKLSKECRKSYIHLGLGVNDGVRRFKEKWGGKPTHRYEMCELVLKKHSFLSAVLSMQKKLMHFRCY